MKADLATGDLLVPRYAANCRFLQTRGVQSDAKLDDGNMWVTSFALIQSTAAEEATIKALVKKAVR